MTTVLAVRRERSLCWILPFFILSKAIVQKYNGYMPAIRRNIMCSYLLMQRLIPSALSLLPIYSIIFDHFSEIFNNFRIEAFSGSVLDESQGRLFTSWL